jgi:hypothetical protein
VIMGDVPGLPRPINIDVAGNTRYPFSPPIRGIARGVVAVISLSVVRGCLLVGGFGGGPQIASRAPENTV